MAKKKRDLGVSVTQYEISREAIERPRVLKLGRAWVGVGGKVWRESKPPYESYWIQEATEEQYMELARRGSLLVKLKGE